MKRKKLQHTIYQFRAQKDADGKTIKEQGKDVYFKNITPENVQNWNQEKIRMSISTIQSYSSPLILSGLLY